MNSQHSEKNRESYNENAQILSEWLELFQYTKMIFKNQVNNILNMMNILKYAALDDSGNGGIRQDGENRKKH